ncbi:hypothetical protein ABL78_0692 [Leptomonas seymouri]|uniref:Uncharacterized protein n=1 Tax=Leptomonas seymouri TaxID=5684 RepID=A0A0N1I395_LEPSE|nr:hypothetical protein ABL78_0692 [Leptomonas seymouri]|eukprot:KPI90174.1 hypothetical protein ABL78_0692 [Leptomonas seymouri]
MLRRLSAKCTPAVRRHWCLSNRCFIATTSVQRAVSQAKDDFFVDIDNLAGFGEVAESAGSSCHQQPASQAHPSSISSAPSLDALGVVRNVPEDENVRYSRLQIPLAVREDGAGADGVQMRSNARAALKLGEEARYADESAGPTRKTETNESSKRGESSRDGTSTLEKMHSEESADAGGNSRLPDPTRLPYDDERFAEMLLEMEVNGVIDETWQDARKAHIEDVKEIASILASLKVRDMCCIDVSEKTSNFDYMMFGTCEGPRHIHLAAWAAQDADKVHRISKIKRKQTDELWEVVPIGRIVLNLMVESFREEMTLERKWVVTRSMDPLAAANAPISEGRQVKAHGLWTLTLNLQDLEDFEVDYCKDILMRQM